MRETKKARAQSPNIKLEPDTDQARYGGLREHEKYPKHNVTSPHGAAPEAVPDHPSSPTYHVSSPADGLQASDGVSQGKDLKRLVLTAWKLQSRRCKTQAL